MQQKKGILYALKFGLPIIGKECSHLKIFKRLTCLPRYEVFSRNMDIRPKKFTDNLEEKLQGNKTLKPVSDFENIKDFDDKFGLDDIRDPLKLLAHLRECNYAYEFDDLVYFLRRIAQLCEEKNLRIGQKENMDMEKFVKAIKERLINNEHETYPHIGSFAYCFNKLQIYDKELWTLLEQKILNDQFYTNFTESEYAVEGFVALNMFDDQSRIDDVYKKLERVIKLTVWEVNMIHYKRVVEALVQVNRFSPEIFDKLESHILKNLSMDYELSTMIDILFAFAKSGNGSKEFYDSMQYVLYRGHMFNRNVMLHFWNEIPYQGRIIARLLEIYKNVGERYETFKFQPDFRARVYNLLISKKTIFDLGSITIALKALPFHNFEDQKTIEGVMMKKVLETEKDKISYHDLLEFIDYFHSIYGALPSPMVKLFEDKFLDGMENETNDMFLTALNFFIERNLVQRPEIFFPQVLNSSTKGCCKLKCPK